MHRSVALAASVLSATVLAWVVPVAGASGAGTVARANVNAQADLRNLASAEDAYLAQHPRHYASFPQLADAGESYWPHQGVFLKIVHIEGNRGYCLSARTNTGRYMYDSQAGGVYVGADCKLTTHGRAGGTRYIGPVGATTAAIAAPRTTDARSPARTDLLKLATLEASYYSSNLRYATFRELSLDPTDGAMRIHAGDTLTIVHLDDRYGYCLRATMTNRTLMYDSQTGTNDVYRGTGCRITRQGRSGGTRTGPAYV